LQKLIYTGEEYSVSELILVRYI